MKAKLKTLGRALKYVWTKTPIEMFIVTAVSLIEGLLPVSALVVLKKFVDVFTANETYAETGLSSASLAVVWILIMIVQYTIPSITTYLLEVTRERCSKELSMSIVGKCISIQGIAHFEDKQFLDINDWLSFTDRSVGPFLYQINDGVKYCTGFISIFALFASFEYWISIVLTVSIVPSMIIAQKRSLEKSHQEEALEALSRKARYYRNTLLSPAAVTEFKLFSFNKLFKHKLLELFSDMEISNVRFQRKIRNGDILGTSIRIIAIGSIFIFMLGKTRDGTVTIGSFAMYLQSLFQFSNNLLMIALVWAYFEGSYNYFSKFFNFLAMEDTIDISRSRRMLVECVEAIRFENVSFTYPSGKQALRNISFSLKAGERVALVGENGAGKSTIIKLLLRLYDPSEGSIYLNDNAILEYDIASYRCKFSGIFQDFMKYDLTVRENIFSDGSGNDDIMNEFPGVFPESELEKLPDGMSSLLGTTLGGVELSGGQWQRLAILRGLAKPHEVLLVDEPTASIDPIEESRIFELVFSRNEGITLCVTHRLGSVKEASRIIVLKDGEVVGDGSHNELIVTNDYYNRLYMSQASMYESKP